MKKIYYLFLCLGISSVMITGCQRSSVINGTESSMSNDIKEEKKVIEESEESAERDTAENKNSELIESKEQDDKQTVLQEEKVGKQNIPDASLQPESREDAVSNTAGLKSKSSSSNINEKDNIEQNEQNRAAQDNIDIQKEEDNITVAVYGNDETILSATEIEYTEGMTAFDALKQVLKNNNIQMEYSGTGKAIYVEGINNLYEFDKGPGSGWLFHVNGGCPSESCSAYTLQKGDEVNWYYTLDFGKDIS